MLLNKRVYIGYSGQRVLGRRTRTGWTSDSNRSCCCDLSARTHLCRLTSILQGLKRSKIQAYGYVLATQMYVSCVQAHVVDVRASVCVKSG